MRYNLFEVVAGICKTFSKQNNENFTEFSWRNNPLTSDRVPSYFYCCLV